MTQPLIILASGSPRRRELLASIGVPFQVIKPGVDEKSFDCDAMTPREKVLFLSKVKAEDVFKQHPGKIVIGADTVVALPQAQSGDARMRQSDIIMEKPKNEADAFRMLKALQDTTHTVHSGIAVFHPNGNVASDALATDVHFRPMSDAQIKAYIATGEPMDKAGAYAIQGYGSVQIERINGCYFNVVGMSLFLLEQLFDRLGERLIQP